MSTNDMACMKKTDIFTQNTNIKYGGLHSGAHFIHFPNEKHNCLSSANICFKLKTFFFILA